MSFDPAVLGLAGALLTTAIASLTSSLIEVWKYKAETRTDAYKSFIETSSQITTFSAMMGPGGPRGLTPKQQETWLDLLMRFRTAKAKVALYGSPNVLSKLGLFTSAHAAMASDADAEAYIGFIEAMRRDSFARDYGGFRGDVDRLMVRDEMQMGADGRVTTMRQQFAAHGGKGGAAAAISTSVAFGAPA